VKDIDYITSFTKDQIGMVTVWVTNETDAQRYVANAFVTMHTGSG